MKKFLVVALVAMLFAVAASAQSTTVSGQVTDAGGQSWNNGTITFTFIPNPAYPTGPYTWTGGTLPLNVSGTLNGTGAYSVSVPSNSAISPIGSKWLLQVSSPASSPGFSVNNLTIAGGAQTVNVTPPTILINLQTAVAPVAAYTDAEITGVALGSQYYNIGSAANRICTATSGNTCSNWTAVGGATSLSQLTPGVAGIGTYDFSGATVLPGIATQFQVWGAPAANQIGPINCTPPATNGTFPIVYNVTGSAIVSSTCPQSGLTPRSINGGATLDTVLFSDNQSVVLHDKAASGAVVQTLPTPATLVNTNFVYSYVNASAQTDTITPTTWTIQLGNASAAASISVPSGASVRIIVDPFVGSRWHADCNGCSAASSSFSSLTSSTVSNTPLLNGNFQWTGRWAPTTDAQGYFIINESTAATGGTVTNNMANQFLASFTTLAGSTAAALNVSGNQNGTNTNPIFNFSATLNNGATIFHPFALQFINTASAANTRCVQMYGGAAGTSNTFNIDCNGGVFANTTVTANGTGFLGAFYTGLSQNGAVVIQGGLDTAFNGGTNGSLTARGANNSSTTNASAGGSFTANGGDATGATGNTIGGAFSGRGGNVATTGAGTPGAATLGGGGFTGAATNGVGADLTLFGGLGTGNATPSHVKIQQPCFVSASGTGAQAQCTRFVTHSKAGSTTTATATNMFNLPLAVNQTVGFKVLVHVESTQATPQNCSTTQEFYVSVQNTGGTITSNVTSATASTICSTGTLTIAVAASAANPTVISVTPSWTTIVPTAVIISTEIDNLSQQDTALL